MRLLDRLAKINDFWDLLALGLGVTALVALGWMVMRMTGVLT